MTENHSQTSNDAVKSSSRLAASVILLREGPNGAEVFVQHRASTMDFAAGAVAFPGGRADDEDSSDWGFEREVIDAHATAWASTDAARNPWQRRDKVGKLIAAALREVAEECGIALSAKGLVPWANWMTPEGLPKRFDTYFFVTVVGDGVEPRHQTTEATRSHWARISALIEDQEAGVLTILPPTLSILDELQELSSVEEIVLTPRSIKTVCLRADGIDEFYRERSQRRGEKAGTVR